MNSVLAVKLQARHTPDAPVWGPCRLNIQIQIQNTRFYNRCGDAKPFPCNLY